MFLNRKHIKNPKENLNLVSLRLKYFIIMIAVFSYALILGPFQ